MCPDFLGVQLPDTAVTEHPMETAPAPQADESKHAQANNPTRVPQERSAVGRAGSWFGVLLFVLVAAALAFYGGIRYQKARAVFANGQVTSTVAQPTPESPEARFDRERREVDAQPAAMEQRYAGELLHQEPQTNEPAFHYLYGRALLLSGKPQDAQREFAQVVQLLTQHEEKVNGRDSLRIETRIATAAAALKSKDLAALDKAARDLDEVIEQQNKTGAPGGLATPTPAPAQ